ncbi:hypothetical protein ACX8XP_08915 [Calditrichota bacterium LG25]
MKNSIKWILAIILTLSAAYYQRATGPTYPLKTSFEIAGKQYKMKFPRSHGGFTPQPITLAIPDTSVKAELHFRRYKMNEPWTVIPMVRENETLKADLPAQPPAGKLEYFVVLKHGDTEINVPHDSAIVIRFKGEVPAYVLAPHVLFMFLSMLLAMYTLFETLTDGPRIKFYVILTSAVLFVGGMVFGPFVQKFAFDAYWTGVPFGWDLTDNKTLIAMIFWLIALWQTIARGEKRAKPWILLAVVVMFVVFLIPHSVMGSELNYETMSVETGKI